MKHSDDQELDDIAKNFDHTELNHINFTIEIGDLAVMVNNRYVPPTKARPYIKIVNPSQVYNTLIAFTLKQENSIFYYFFGDEATAIHLNFKSQSESVIKVLCLDLLAFENLEEYDSYSDYLFKNQNLKLITLGFIWNMIEYASKYKKDEAWFDYYSSNYSFTCSAISLKTFYKNFGKTHIKIY